MAVLADIKVDRNFKPTMLSSVVQATVGRGEKKLSGDVNDGQHYKHWFRVVKNDHG